MDDRDGVAAARSQGFAVTATLGILDLAARRDLIRLDEALERLKATSFRCGPGIVDALLARMIDKGTKCVTSGANLT
jgi:predicted nucleic acid-binding protein